MPRMPRVFIEDGIYHVYCRASRGEAVFVDETEAAAFVDILRRVKCRAGGECTPFWGVRDPNHNSPQIIDLRGIVGGGGGNRTHVRGTPIAGFSVCSRRFKSHPVVGRPATYCGASPKISVTAFGRRGDPAHQNNVEPQIDGRDLEADVAT